MATEPITCPSCPGRKTTLTHVYTADPAGRGFRELPCSTCGGTGTITAEHAARIAEGERRREDRKRRMVTLREEAKRLNLTPKELSDIENGRIE